MEKFTHTIESIALKGKAWIFATLLISSQLVSAQTVVQVIVDSPNHTTLEAAVLAAELDGTLSGTGPFTVFAPTDAAFDALPEGTVSALLANIPALTAILTYHVVGSQALSTDLTNGMEITTLNGNKIKVTIDDDGVKIDDVALVTTADIMADNGVVHVIDAVLIPPAASVADIIIDSPIHTTLEAAVIAADLEETLKGDGSFTVFAPTDAAFDALPEGTVAALLADIPALTAILTYHVVGSQALSTDLSDGMEITTLNGKKVTVTIDGSGVKINGVAMVIGADIMADNGVVHVIDAVLLPSYDVQITENATYGSILTDGSGKTLYFFTPDADGSSACAGGCLDNWPVFYDESLYLSAGLNPDDFDAIDRGAGVMQTTYKGWPLYYFANDLAAGEVNGEGLINKWFVAKPDYTVMLTDNQLVGNDGLNYTGAYAEGDEVIQYLVDAYGKTLYTWKNDRNNRNRFTAADLSNNGAWPIFNAEGLIVPSTLDANDFDLIDVHGETQMTFKGWPLYHFGQDAMRGDNKGVSVPAPGVWPVAVPDMMQAAAYTVVDIVVFSPDHTTLEAAVIAADLAETLSGAGPFTVFAPTDAAFAALPEGTVDALLADIPTLTAILTYHVVGSQALSTDLTDKQKIITVNGKKVTITIDETGVKINNVAMVVTADILADNGVVHVIDAVLLPPPATVVDIIVASPEHTTLEAAVIAAGLDATLSGAGPFTVFAPTDAAFDALPAGTVDALLADIPTLTAILTYHVVGAEAWSRDLSDMQKIITVNGKKVTITIDETGVKINNVAMVVTADILADNGVVHVIDAVLLPPPATVVDIIVASPEHTTLEAAVIAAGLDATLSGAGPFTVFAPTDAAFDALPAGTVDALLADIPTLTAILTYHVAGAEAWSRDLSDMQKIITVNGKKVTITIDETGVKINNVAMVVTTDILADNGVVHVIDAVLLPPPATVVDIIVDSPVHTTLEAAVIAADLVGALSGDGPFTVFAPTDDAFAALPEGTVDALLADIPALTAILTYHVAGAEAWSSDLSDGMEITTLNGKKVMITIDGTGVTINGVAMVITADILADNGVVHVIDAVLIPPTITVVDIIVDSPVHTTLEAAVIAADLVETLSGDGPFTVFAPTDDAFAALPEGTLDALLADIPALTAILTYHVVGSKALSTDLSHGMEITTVNGEKITVSIDGSGVKINGVAMVITADILADNGVVHVIDAVLIPGATSIRDEFSNQDARLSIHPNPASSDVHFTFSLQSTQQVSVEIYNTFGQLIETVNHGTLPAGSNSIRKNVSALSNGIYMVVITAGNEQTVSKLQIRK